ncbi:MAG: ABC transporter ATP-binding protein [Breznakibacter sp.]
MKRSSRQGFKFLIYSLRLVWQSSPKWSMVNTGIVLLRGAIPLVVLFLIKWLIDEVGIIVQQPVGQRQFDDAIWLIAFAGALFLTNSLASSFGVLAREKQSHKVNDLVQNLIHNKTTRISYSFFEDPDYQDVYFRAISDANYRPSRIFFGLIGLLQSTVTMLLLGGMLLSLNWWMAGLLMLILFPSVYQRMLFSRRMFRLHRSQTEDERRVAYYNRLLTTRDYAKELRVFNLGDVFRSRFEKLRLALRHKQMLLLVRKTKGEVGTQLLTAFAIVFFYGIIVVDTIKGHITQGTMIMYFLALQRGYGYFQDLLSRISSLYEDSLFVRNFIELIGIETGGTQPTAQKPSAFPEKIIRGIHFQNVSFRYPHNPRWTLDNITFDVQPGETIALVGANGAGKTTLVKLLAGLYAPTQGKILIDQTDLSSISQASLAENMSVIFQDFMLYNTSARENIWLGNVNKSVDDPGVEKAANEAGVHDLISGLKQGYSTTLGNLFQGSEELSQGEWQRMALARSFFNNAQVIILDEPTASLDAFTEARLIGHFREIVQGRTAFIVSHRLSTINLADKIAVLENSRLVEFGPKDELLQKKGAYYKMITALK